MRALLALPLLLLALVPTVAAAPDLQPAQPDPVGCFTAPYFPETPLYYIVWWCTAGQLGVPEPIEFLTGCHMGFPATSLHCNWDDGALTGPVIDCIRECVYVVPPCFLGPC